jgi:type I restriction enzyme S subunit
MIDGKNLPQIPQSWQWVKFHDVFEVGQGGTPSTSVSDYWNGSIPWLRSGEIRFNRIKESKETISELGLQNSPARLLPKGTILLAMTGQGLTRGRAAILDIDASGNQSCAHLIPQKNIVISEFLFYYFRSEYWEVRSFDKGSNQPGLNTAIIKEFTIPIPPLHEQLRIVTKIEELFTQLDAGVASLKKVQAQLKRYRQAVLKAAFEGRLTQDWREEYKGEIEPADVLFDRIKRKNAGDEKEIAKRLPLDESELFQLPDEWIWIQSQDVCENITNGYTPTADKLFGGEGEIPFIKVYNLTKTGAFDFTVKPTFISRETHEKELRRSAVYPDDVLMNIVGPPLGKISLVPDLYREWNINQAIVIYRTFPEYSRKLMLYALLSEIIQKWLQKRGKTTAGQTNYTITMSRSLPIPLPPHNEQSLIVNEIERHFSQIDHLEKTVETSLKQAETLRQSILKWAFEGKLVPQDPTDEPASVLLERIKAEKVKTRTNMNKGKRVRNPIEIRNKS